MRRRKRWGVYLLLTLLTGVVSAKPGNPPKESAPPPTLYTLKYTLATGAMEYFRISATLDGTAKVGFFTKVAKGTVVEKATLWKAEDRPDGLVKMKSRCKIESSTLTPAFITGYICADESEFLMHPLNPFNVGLYPLIEVKPGDVWPYYSPWDDRGQKGSITGKYKLLSVKDKIAEIEAEIDYENEYTGVLGHREEVHFRGKVYLSTENGKLKKVVGSGTGKVNPTLGVISGSGFDVKFTVQADAVAK